MCKTDYAGALLTRKYQSSTIGRVRVRTEQHVVTKEELDAAYRWATDFYRVPCNSLGMRSPDFIKQLLTTYANPEKRDLVFEGSAYEQARQLKLAFYYHKKYLNVAHFGLRESLDYARYYSRLRYQRQDNPDGRHGTGKTPDPFRSLDPNQPPEVAKFVGGSTKSTKENSSQYLVMGGVALIAIGGIYLAMK